MREQINFFLKKDENKVAKIAIFLSGSGTNAEKILEYQKELKASANFETQVLVTDCPKSSRTYEIAEKFELPVIALGLKDFYKEYGLESTSLCSTKGREVRQLWTAKLTSLLDSYCLDFGVFAGFVPLSNITDKLPCLNIHPGDLTYKHNGERVLVGLHTIPIEKCLQNNLEYMRSTVIVASNYEGVGSGMDNGVILGLSREVKVELPVSYNELKENKENLKKVLVKNQEKLKVNGDWETLPYVVNDFARGIFAFNKDGKLLVKINGKFLPCQYIEYGTAGSQVIRFSN